MKCLLCRERKGKRYCPAKNSQICAQCCGEKRVVEILCPADCQYLAEGQSFQGTRKLVAILESIEDPRRRQRFYESTRYLHNILGLLEMVIVRSCANLRSIRDKDILEAVKVLDATYSTESKGIIYQHHSPNPLAQGLSRELHEELENLRKDAAKEGRPLRLADLQVCLETLQTMVEYHIGQNSEADTYLHFITRNHPEAASQARKSRQLII